MTTVAIVGAGVGGLTLAHGLRSHGFDVHVLERQTDLRDTVGHEIQLDAHAMRALSELMPATWMRRLYSLAQSVWVETGYSVRDEAGRLLAANRDVATPEGVMTDRLTLRLMLAAGLEDALRLGAEVVSFEQRDAHPVRVLLADGHHIEADLLVAADGVGSSITSALAGGPTSEATSLIGFAGRTTVSALSPAAHEVYGSGAVIAVGPGGCGLYAGRHDQLDQQLVTGFAATPLHADPVVIWGAVMLEWARTAPLSQMRGETLRAHLVEELTAREWATALTDVVSQSDAASVSGFRFHSAASYAAGLAPWQPGVVTALGDAVHAMPPTGGMSASTAIRDAHVLCTELLRGHGTREQIVDAVQRYETQMREYASGVIAAARRPSAWVLSGPVPGGPLLPFARERSLATAAVSWSQRDQSLLA